MRVERGDIVYNSIGKPGVVTGRDEISRKIEVENQGGEYNKSRHFGFINGLKPLDREHFNKVIEAARQEQEPSKRIELISAVINELSNDPRNIQLVKYLEAEKAHLMYSENIMPRTYTMDETKVG